MSKIQERHQYEDLTRTRSCTAIDFGMTIDATMRYWLEMYADSEERMFRDFNIVFKKMTELGSFPDAEIKGLPPHDDEASGAEKFGWLVELEEQEALRLEDLDQRRIEKLERLEQKYGTDTSELQDENTTIREGHTKKIGEEDLSTIPGEVLKTFSRDQRLY